MTRKRVLYITDAMLRRKGACDPVLDQLNEVLGTRKRKVPVTVNVAIAVERTFYRLEWAVDVLLTLKQRRVYAHEAMSVSTRTDPVEAYRDMQNRRARAFVTAYYSPKK